MTAEAGPVRQQAGPPEWFKPGKSSRSRSHARSRSTASTRSHAHDSDSLSDSSSSSSDDDRRSGKVSYREWMDAGSRVKKDETGHRLIWGYENIHEQLADKATPLVLKEQELKKREEEERRLRRQERREKKRAEKEDRRKRRKKEKQEKESHLERVKEAEEEEEEDERGERRYEEEPKKSSKKYDLKEAAKEAREAQKTTGHITSTVQGKSILLNLLQHTLHENRVRDGDLIDRARVVFRQAGYDEGGRRDVKLLSAHLNSASGRPPSPQRGRGNENKDDLAEVVPLVSYDEFKQKQQEAKTEDRKAKIKAKMKEQKAKAQAFILAQEKEKMARKSAEHASARNEPRAEEISASVDSLLASVSASLEEKSKVAPSKNLTSILWSSNFSSDSLSSFVPSPPDTPPPSADSVRFPLPPLPPFPHLPS